MVPAHAMTCRAVRQTGRPAAAWCRLLPARTGTSEQTWSKHGCGRCPAQPGQQRLPEPGRRPGVSRKRRVRSVIAAAGVDARWGTAAVGTLLQLMADRETQVHERLVRRPGRRGSLLHAAIDLG